MPEIDGVKEKTGKHPYGDAGPLVLPGLLPIVWRGDSLFYPNRRS
jgi:hypothetical protein